MIKKYSILLLCLYYKCNIDRSSFFINQLVRILELGDMNADHVYYKLTNQLIYKLAGFLSLEFHSVIYILAATVCGLYN